MKRLILEDLKKIRQAQPPRLPSLLRTLSNLSFSRDQKLESDAQIRALFPLTCDQPVLMAKKESKRSSKPLQIGVVLSGGQAAGGHNVIIGIHDALKQLNPHSRLFGFLEGPGGIILGKSKELKAEIIAPYFNQGGFDMIGSGRTKIESDEQLRASLAVVQQMKLDGLVFIGGDDSNTNAAVLAEYFLKNECQTKIIGVPKTIDGDLKNPYVCIPFGFDSASKTYAEIIGNIARDSISAKKYYHFIKLMGRSASHLALECALTTQPNLAIIGEEVAAQKMTLAQITNQIADLIVKRAEVGKQFGVILIPEGLIEFIFEVNVLIKELNLLLSSEALVPMDKIIASLTMGSQRCFESLPEKIQQQLIHTRDPHGNVQVSLIETERLLIETVSKELEERQKKGKFKGKFSALPHFLGYEGRAGFPTHFDSNYCYSLGFAAALLVDEGVTGYMAFISDLTKPVSEWAIGGVPLTSLMHIEMRKGKEKPVVQKAYVELNGNPFLYFKQRREQWMLEDQYLYPGPIQFFGAESLTDQVPMTLLIESLESA